MNQTVETGVCETGLNVWCGLLCDRVVGPFCFTESAITGDI
jgi:hypothetical protein